MVDETLEIDGEVVSFADENLKPVDPADPASGLFFVIAQTVERHDLYHGITFYRFKRYASLYYLWNWMTIGRLQGLALAEPDTFRKA